MKMNIKSERIDSKELESEVKKVFSGRSLLAPKSSPDPQDGTFLGGEHEALKLRALEAMEFIQSHPAFEDRVSTLLWLHPAKVCKRGISAEDGMVSVHLSDPGAERFIEEFEAEFEQELPNFAEAIEKFPLWSISKSYEEVHGEPWAIDRIEYWWEIAFSVYHGSVERKSSESFHEKNWQSYQLDSGGKLTYEECIIELADLAKKYLGDFESYDFETSEEKDNHSANHPFDFEPTNETIFNPITGQEEETSMMVENEGWLTVTSGMLNRRWLAWFVKTDYCQAQWKDEFDKITAIQPDSGS